MMKLKNLFIKDLQLKSLFQMVKELNTIKMEMSTMEILLMESVMDMAH